MKQIKSICSGKSVLFITTKNLDYIRNEQEVKIIEKIASDIQIIGSKKRNYFVRLVYVYIKLLLQKMKGVDVVFVGFAPQLILPLWTCKFRKKILIVDFFISMYDTFVCDRKIIKKDSFIAAVLHRIDEKTLRYSDLVISDSRAHGNFFCEEFGIDSLNIEILYLEANKSIYYPREQKKIKLLEHKFVVLYFGSILPLQGVEVVMKTVELLKEEKDIYFYIIGPFKSKLERIKGNNVEYIDWLSQKELAEYIAMADLCLAGHFSADIEKAKRTIPGKAYIYDAMEKKMILGDNEANREIFQEDDRRYFVKMGDPGALAEKIVEIMKKERE